MQGQRFNHSDAPAPGRQPELPGYIDQLQRNIGEVEQNFGELRGRLGIVVRPQEPKAAAGGETAPVAVANTELGGQVQALALRVGTLNDDICSLIRRLEV